MSYRASFAALSLVFFCAPALAQDDLGSQVEALSDGQSEQQVKITNLEAAAAKGREQTGSLSQLVESLSTELDALYKSVYANTAAIESLLKQEAGPSYGIGAAANASGIIEPIAVIGGRTGSVDPKFSEVALGVGWSADQWDAVIDDAVAVLNGKESMVCISTQDAKTGREQGMLSDGTPVDVCITTECSAPMEPGQIAVDPVTFMTAARVMDGNERKLGLCCMMP
ncbi:MAG: hypothetical protein EP330_26225 [Deltaproteobacteria bacterium]|nr:MAG: hypothetical protein EP330_26225 [Deltaproteobacteria bacterium]